MTTTRTDRFIFAQDGRCAPIIVESGDPCDAYAARLLAETIEALTGAGDCGRPGNAILIAALVSSQGALYAGTLETGADQSGLLWRYEGRRRWCDLGNPDGCNIVHSVVEFDGALYCGTGRYNTHGSVLGPIRNRTPGGRVYRVDSDGQWICVGHPGAKDATAESDPSLDPRSGKADDATALTVFQGDLYCTSNHREGVFVHEGGDNWRSTGLNERVISFGIYRDHLYALINGGPVYRYEGGSDWSYCGRPGESEQTYGCVVHNGRLYVGTWPQGRVYRYEGGETWGELPRRHGWVGYDCEVMAMALYNAKVYVGSLPTANVWRMDRERFTFLATLDTSPVIFRRVWSMAVHDGKLFAGTLPSGHVYSARAGKLATWDQAFPGGWHHVAAVRRSGILKTFVDGAEAARTAASTRAPLDTDNDRPLYIGAGPHDCFCGSLSDLRLYRRALSRAEIGALAQRVKDQ